MCVQLHNNRADDKKSKVRFIAQYRTQKNKSHFAVTNCPSSKTIYSTISTTRQLLSATHASATHAASFRRHTPRRHTPHIFRRHTPRRHTPQDLVRSRIAFHVEFYFHRTRGYNPQISTYYKRSPVARDYFARIILTIPADDTIHVCSFHDLPLPLLLSRGMRVIT